MIGFVRGNSSIKIWFPVTVFEQQERLDGENSGTKIEHKQL